ncbi:coiled-coil domain-containing protein 152-like [Periophthalmus magnuspinnatus]|uniref:coiled-coil domain-containing protein 152-like n=1 Tax=Periophthalmus magnuspinnatus TaxID=409849 RepID=UPI00145A3D10|nr:coiled-coil domain-containing protein 152-like [Periophthalmus magnuspinnatus]
MAKLNCVNLDVFLEKFSSLEETITKVQCANSMFQLKSEDSGRALKHSQSKEKALLQERDCLLGTVKELQQSLEAQCHVRVEKDRLQNELEEIKKEETKKAQEAEGEVQRLVAEMRAKADHHQMELEAVRLQCRRDVEEAHAQAALKMEAKEVDMKRTLQQKEQEVQELWSRLREQEKEHTSDIFKLQIEFGAKLTRVQSSVQMNQQQRGANLPQNIFRRKLQLFQEEKNKEVAALRQRIRELEQGQMTGLKRKKEGVFRVVLARSSAPSQRPSRSRVLLSGMKHGLCENMDLQLWR